MRGGCVATDPKARDLQQHSAFVGEILLSLVYGAPTCLPTPHLSPVYSSCENE